MTSPILNVHVFQFNDSHFSFYKCSRYLQTYLPNTTKQGVSPTPVSGSRLLGYQDAC